MTEKEHRLENLKLMIEMNVPDTLIEIQFLAYLKSQHGVGLKLIFWVMSKMFYDWLKQKKLRLSYFWNVRIRKQNARTFFANRIGMTEAALASIENETEV